MSEFCEILISFLKELGLPYWTNNIMTGGRPLLILTAVGDGYIETETKSRHFTEDTFKRIFLSENVRISIEFPWSLLLRVQLTVFQHWFR